MKSNLYEEFLPTELTETLWNTYNEIDGIAELRVDPKLLEQFPQIETPDALRFVVELFGDIEPQLRQVLHQRVVDREFVDRHTASFVEHNADLPFDSPDYKTVIGMTDDNDRIVVGPKNDPNFVPRQIDVPEFLRGEHVTLFGPPDTAKLSINAMNSLHRKPQGEAQIIGELVDASGQVPRWGADNEDSKTPIMSSFLHACENLMGCFDGTLELDEGEKKYKLAPDRRAIPIKRIPGLALPDGNHLLGGAPLPLHLLDFAMHMFHNWNRPEALVFYVPKLENEEEAAYLQLLIETAERSIKNQHPEYAIGTVKLFIVFENPRAIFRIREIADTLFPYFVGGSLGWHDFLGATARLFKNDPRYRIPVKADPNIVINHIRESHEILVDALAPLGGVTIGGMYGVLYEANNPASYEVAIVGYIKDVVTQLKRGLDGFWVAHPDFVRPGIALVEAWRRHERGSSNELNDVIDALVPSDAEREPLREFVFGDDVEGLPKDAPGYARSVLAADIETSDVIANDDPEEVRYNVFQALQYLADWLWGNGCVALPATLQNSAGEPVAVRVMDDLATTERSRWELWAEVHHGRVSIADFNRIVEEEMAFIKEDRVDGLKRTAVKWEDAMVWYELAEEILKKLVVTKNPPEFATELLMKYTFVKFRNAHALSTFR